MKTNAWIFGLMISTERSQECDNSNGQDRENESATSDLLIIFLVSEGDKSMATYRHDMA